MKQVCLLMQIRLLHEHWRLDFREQAQLLRPMRNASLLLLHLLAVYRYRILETLWPVCLLLKLHLPLQNKIQKR